MKELLETMIIAIVDKPVVILEPLTATFTPTT